MGYVRNTKTYLEKITEARLRAVKKLDDFKVGDQIKFMEVATKWGATRNELHSVIIREGIVVAVYKYIVHVQYQVGQPEERNNLYRSFNLGQYLCGVIRKK